MGRMRGRGHRGGRSNGYVKKTIPSHRQVTKMRLGKKTSEVWNYFEQMAHEPGENPKSRCNICNVVFKCPGGSTTGMRGHLERKHPGTLSTNSVGLTITPINSSLNIAQDEYDEEEDFSMDNIDQSETYVEETMSVSNNSDSQHQDFYDEGDEEDEFQDLEAVKGDFEHEEISRSLAYMCVLDLKPLSLQEGDGFRNFVSYFDSSYVLASYNSPDSIKSVAACIEEMYENEASKMRGELLNKDVCLSVETWDKNNLDKYLIITANFITSDCTFSSTLLSTKLLPRLAITSKPDQNRLKSDFLSVVKEGAELFDVHKEQITSIVVNSELFEQVETDQGMPIVVPCLNAIVKMCFNNLQKVVEGVLGYDMFESASFLAYKYISDYENLRRNPFLLLVALEEHKPTLEQIEENKIQWNYLPALIALLSPINDVIDITSDEDKVYLSTVFPLICAIKEQLVEGTEDFTKDDGDNDTTSMKPLIESFIKVIMDSLQNGYQIELNSEDYGSYIICICCFLDPRYKALKFISNEQRQSIHDATIALMTDSNPPPTSKSTGKTDSLGSKNRESLNGGGSSSSSTGSGKVIQTRSRYTSDTTMNSNEPLTGLQRIRGKNWEYISSSEATTEIQKYLKHPVPSVTTDPLDWWSKYRRLYPNLYAIALKFLGLSAIASRAQHVFTDLGAKLDQTRGALEDNYLDKVLFLHQIVKNSLAEPSAGTSTQFQNALSEMSAYDMVQADLKQGEGEEDLDEEEEQVY